VIAHHAGNSYRVVHREPVIANDLDIRLETIPSAPVWINFNGASERG
jgi:hypothetical protein